MGLSVVYWKVQGFFAMWLMLHFHMENTRFVSSNKMPLSPPLQLEPSVCHGIILSSKAVSYGIEPTWNKETLVGYDSAITCSSVQGRKGHRFSFYGWQYPSHHTTRWTIWKSLCLIKTKHCNNQSSVLMQCDFCSVFWMSNCKTSSNHK